MPHVKVSVGLYLKDKPEGYQGLTNVTGTIGDEPATFSSLVYGFVRSLLGFYLDVMPTPTDELNAQIQEVGKDILNLKVALPETLQRKFRELVAEQYKHSLEEENVPANNPTQLNQQRSP